MNRIQPHYQIEWENLSKFLEQVYLQVGHS